MFCVATAPTPARACGQREPTQIDEVVIATPNMPVVSHLPVIENVMASSYVVTSDRLSVGVTQVSISGIVINLVGGVDSGTLWCFESITRQCHFQCTETAQNIGFVTDVTHGSNTPDLAIEWPE